MKNLFYFLALVASVSFFASCGDDEEMHSDDDPQYSITIMSPSTDDKNLNDDIHIHVNFESASDETVHHVNVRIINKDDNSIVAYDRSADNNMHVHETSGKYEWHHDFSLTEANNVTAHSDWILEAKVWGHEADQHELTETIEFHVHPE